MISVLNCRKIQKPGPAVLGFDLRYHGLCIEGCMLFESATRPGQHYIRFPERAHLGEDGKIRFERVLFFSKLEIKHVFNLVMADIAAQGIDLRNDKT